ncbi:MAG: PEP-CTERM sorting domain-containing protein, partial [Singulisphaera sp.]
TLGVAADDFQQPRFKLPFVAKVNQVVNAALTNQLNAMDLGTPEVRFFSVGIDPAILAPSNVLELSIEREGPGSDGWAVDYTTVGVTTAQPVPEPTTLSVMVLGAVALGLRTYRRRRNAPGTGSAR